MHAMDFIKHNLPMHANCLEISFDLIIFNQKKLIYEQYVFMIYAGLTVSGLPQQSTDRTKSLIFILFDNLFHLIGYTLTGHIIRPTLLE